MTQAIRSIVDEMIVALAPLVGAAGDQERLARLLSRLGWMPASMPQPLLDLSAAGSSLLDALGAEEGDLSQEAALAAVKQLIDSIDAIRGAPDDAFPAGIDVAEFRATIGRDLLDYLVVEHLLCNRHTAGALLRLAGIIRLVEEPAVGLRQPFFRRRIEWGTIGTLLTDPVAGFQQGFAWNSAAPALSSASGVVASLLERLGLVFTYFVPDGDLLSFLLAGAVPADPLMGLDLLLDGDRDGGYAGTGGLRLVIRPATAERGPAIALLPYAQLALDQTFALTDRVSVSVHGDVDFAHGVSLTLAPGRPLALDTGFVGGTPGASAGVAVKVAVAPPSDGSATLVLGSATGSRLSVNGLSASAGATRTSTNDVDAFVVVELVDARVVIRPDPDTDSFLGSLIGEEGISATASLGMRLSTLSGFSLTRSGTLSATYPVGVHLGPVDVTALSFGVAPNGNGVDFEVGASIAGRIGPISVQAEGVGFRLATRFPDPPVGNLGPVDVALGFKPPTGVGLTIDAHGVVTGGGFLRFDPGAGLYAGVLQLTLQEELTLTAYGLIATRLPDGRPGYSLLVFITAEGFEPIPLGLGFVLQSIGGLIGVHRTFDAEVLRAGLKTDTLGTLLFPRDPVGNAPALLRALAAAFPAQRGSLLVGLLARITWFTPTLIQLDLALVLETGVRTRLLVLGRVSALLPSAENDLIRLVLDAVGVLDFDASTLAVDAVLVDSRLAHRFPVTGSAAVRARWGEGEGEGDDTAAEGKYFVAAAGGLHPRFAAPAGFPALERVAIALTTGTNPRLVCDAYFAVTANTVQFGARASLYAAAVGFSVSGDLGFDALVTLVPPHFLVDFYAAVQLKRGAHHLFKVALAGTLEGPLPLRLAARATFEILWVDFTVHFDYTLAGGTATAPRLPAVALEAAVRAALANPANWRTQRAPGGGGAHGVALRALPGGAGAGAGLVLDPLGRLVVTQQVAPLNLQRDVETDGGAAVTGARRFALTGQLNTTAGTPVRGAFAPTRYFRLSDDAKLAAPSFETMDAGLELGDAAVAYPAAALVPAALAYEPITLNPAGVPSTPSDPAARYALAPAQLAAQAATGAAARAPGRAAGRARFRTPGGRPAARLAGPQWKILRVRDGTEAPVAPGLTTWSEYEAALATLNRGGAEWQLVPTHELVA